ncbi:unannotated protein [freshwater metagenome]|uniref:Unannotated protein n=1 Tax=freshwater metagenome TaxID=449393 RepID=A0A6J6DSN8_9ZZZZ
MRIAAVRDSSVGISTSPIMRGGLGLVKARLDLAPVKIIPLADSPAGK